MNGKEIIASYMNGPGRGYSYLSEKEAEREMVLVHAMIINDQKWSFLQYNKEVDVDNFAISFDADALGKEFNPYQIQSITSRSYSTYYSEMQEVDIPVVRDPMAINTYALDHDNRQILFGKPLPSPARVRIIGSKNVGAPTATEGWKPEWEERFHGILVDGMLARVDTINKEERSRSQQRNWENEVRKLLVSMYRFYGL